MRTRDGGNRTAWPFALALALTLLLAGCASSRCMPAVEVRNCGAGAAAGAPCAPEPGERVVRWDPEAGALWPPVARLIEGTAAGETAEASWSAEQERAFWAFWDVPAERPDKHLFFVHEGETFRVADHPCA
jgi:hypothetical protein